MKTILNRWQTFHEARNMRKDEQTILKIKGGASVPHDKITAEGGSVRMPASDLVVLPLQQHIGSPCVPRVKKGDQVYAGQVIADTDALIAAPIHATVSGTVKYIRPYLLASGEIVEAIVIENDGEYKLSPKLKPPIIEGLEDFLHAVRASGMVGIGGAGFPLHGKLRVSSNHSIDTLLINGAECEPYITTDYREMMENSHHLLEGIDRIMHYVGINECLIGIEKNKPKAIFLLKREIEEQGLEDRIKVVALPSHYPHGAEKMLIYTMTGRKVPVGGLPNDVGIIVLNVSSVSVLNYYFDTGIPLIRKRITVAGNAILWPQNLFVPIGTSIQCILDFCGNFIEEPEKIILGGPMMGLSLYSTQGPLMKQNNAILCLTKEETYSPKDDPCIRCGRCAMVCPMNLVPPLIETASKQNDQKGLIRLKVRACMECGSCSYACPARRPLLQFLRHGKKVAIG